MASRHHDAARVFEVLPYRDAATGRQFLVHQDGSVIRGRHAGGDLAEEAFWALAAASGYAVWLRRRWLLCFLGIRDRTADPLLYQFAPDLTGLQPYEVGAPAMVWAGHEVMTAIGDPRTAALYDRVIAHLQQASTRPTASASPAPLPLTLTRTGDARARSHQE
ncbi:hypothetical protein AB0C27_53820 [Nonomuraea sp. NPDC048882]|uniref:hypothetical protein n=1 Tax=Nonomuraea sp. NPDC048882 TaxID=3154347 RepID=UPI00340A5229